MALHLQDQALVVHPVAGDLDIGAQGFVQIKRSVFQFKLTGLDLGDDQEVRHQPLEDHA